MTLLPIVARELRVRSRGSSAYWTRLAGGVLALVVGGILIMTNDLGAGGSAGRNLFYILAWLAFFFCLFEGARAASDSLSQEKREGTMGLLFLTDLSGLDVVLGKMAAISLNLFYALIGMLPVLAMSMVMGGVTGTQFWQTSLALCNTLFFAVSCGMLISSISWSERNAMWGTWLFMVLVMALPTGAALVSHFQTGTTGGGAAWWLMEVARWIGYLSPWNSFVGGLLGGRPAPEFIAGMGILQVVSWTALIYAGFKLPKVWQEKPIVRRPSMVAVAPPELVQSEPSESGLAKVTPEGVRKADTRMTANRRPLLDINPIYWLAMNQGQSGAVAWIIVSVSLVLGIGFVGSTASVMAMFVLAFPTLFFFKLTIAFQACRLFRESRSSGAMELLLCTPMKTSQIVKGQIMAMKRCFLAPMVALCVIQIIPLMLFLLFFGELGGGRFPVVGDYGGPILGGLYVVAVVWLSFYSLTYLGMYMAVRVKNNKGALSQTVLYGVGLPQLLLCCVPLLDIIAHVVVLVVSREGLKKRFRAMMLPDGGKSQPVPSVMTSPAPPKDGPLPEG